LNIHKCVAFVTTSHLQRGKAGSVVIDRLSVSRLIHSLGRPSESAACTPAKWRRPLNLKVETSTPLDRFDFHLP